MTKRPIEYRIRQFATIIMFIAAVIVITTGTILYTIPSGHAGGDITKSNLITIHLSAGFTASGMFLIHIYLNRRPLIRYFKELFS